MRQPGESSSARSEEYSPGTYNLFCDSFAQVPRRVVLDIDDTEDEVHGSQQLSLFHAKHDSHCLLPIHIYDGLTGKPVAVILRPGKTPSGAEVALVLRHVIRRLRRRWPRVEVVVRGDSHYGRHEAMSWCEANGVGYLLGLGTNAVLKARVSGLGEDAALARLDLMDKAAKVRHHAEFRYGAKSWSCERRVIARVEASAQGVDCRFVVTNLAGMPEALYERGYCQRGSAENLIKDHKRHLASDRTSCTAATANQFRLLVHTAAYWLLHTLRGLAPKTSFWHKAQFDILRAHLIKVAGRVRETAARVEVALPSNFAHPDSLRRLSGRIARLPP
ncbi:IS1380 family transposase (plasmid) [Skermanella sp. TT6]|uniref:IS1380 family transposase n=1 Tax=Skermanella cutis TaxID=2775420 RepID=A0ABX7BG35_9PROT|nr:IS1380 family transposase [Skermanella sp. TT6]QQP93162.1 IS1380 family transposase [Skermanella sp. TT6]